MLSIGLVNFAPAMSNRPGTMIPAASVKAPANT